MSKNVVRLGIVDDHNLFRKGLIKLIHLAADGQDKYQILFEAESGKDLKNKIDRDNLPDILLMDIDMPDMDGYETVEWMQRVYPDVRILVISMFETEQAVIRMIKLKVRGYLSKDIEVEDMHMALESIMHKGYYYSEFASDVIFQSFGTIESSSLLTGSKNQHAQFSQRERDFLTYVCTDLTYQQIADKMFLSPKTIDGYREALFQKCKVKSRVALALFAVKNGHVDL